MKLIIGLGNPGTEYNFTRHNFGFLALDFYAEIKGLKWEKEKNHAVWLKDGDRIFIKPQTFYNDSGMAASEFMHFYKIATEDILVINDDFDLPFGAIRFREHGSSAGNNGLKSIQEYLKTTDFARLRLGTNNDFRAKMSDMDFVLGHFSAEEKAKLPEILKEICQKIDQHTK